MFNAFKYTKQLEEAGFSREQAEIQLQVITEIVEGELATKQDLNILDTSMKQDLKTLDASMKQNLKTLEASMRQDLKTLETNMTQDMKILGTNLLNIIEIRSNNLENKMQQLEYRITIKLGTLLVIGFTTMATLMKFWIIN